MDKHIGHSKAAKLVVWSWMYNYANSKGKDIGGKPEVGKASKEGGLASLSEMIMGCSRQL